MDVVTKRGDGVNCVDNVPGKVSWVRGGEADPADARQLPDGRQQLGESLPAGRITVGIYVLPKQLNVGVTRVGHAAGLVKHRLRSTAAFLAARIGHHAIGTKLV